MSTDYARGEGETSYLNTDLDIHSGEEASALAQLLEAKGWSVHHADWHPEGYWFGVFEHPLGHRQGPEQALGLMLDVLEKLPERLRQLWDRCSKRDFNIGYQADDQPRVFEQTVSSDLLRRIAEAGASLSITMYGTSNGRTALG